MPHTVLFATAGTVGLFAVVRRAAYTVVIIGQGTAMVRVLTAGRSLLTVAERDTVRTQFGMPSVGEDPAAMVDTFAGESWDHGLVPPAYRFEEVGGYGVVPAAAVR